MEKNSSIENIIKDFESLLPHLEKNGYCKKESHINNMDKFMKYSEGLEESELKAFLKYSRASKNEGNFALFNQAGKIANHYYSSKIMDENEKINEYKIKTESIKSAEEIFSKSISGYNCIIQEIDSTIKSIQKEFKDFATQHQPSLSRNQWFQNGFSEYANDEVKYLAKLFEKKENCEMAINGLKIGQKMLEHESQDWMKSIEESENKMAKYELRLNELSEVFNIK